MAALHEQLPSLSLLGTNTPIPIVGLANRYSATATIIPPTNFLPESAMNSKSAKSSASKWKLRTGSIRACSSSL
jgi:hypothetical protein